MVGEIERIVAALEQARARYLIVGGVAVVLHGHLRLTADLDLVLQLDEKNARLGMSALERLGYRPRAPVEAQEFARAEQRRQWVEEKGLTVFSMWNPGVPGFEVDVFVAEPFDFDAVHARAERVPLDNAIATVIGLDDLLALKRAAGRPRDLEDIEALESLRDGDS